MSTIRPVRPSTPHASTGLLGKAAVRFQNLIKRLVAVDTGDVWQLYRMTRGSDSVRPSVIRKLAVGAVR